MRSSSRNDKRNKKELARQHYRNRKLDHFFNWCIESKGYVKWRDVIEKQNEFNVIVCPKEN